MYECNKTTIFVSVNTQTEKKNKINMYRGMVFYTYAIKNDCVIILFKFQYYYYIIIS